jgi:hypothetical protein
MHAGNSFFRTHSALTHRLVNTVLDFADPKPTGSSVDIPWEHCQVIELEIMEKNAWIRSSLDSSSSSTCMNCGDCYYYVHASSAPRPWYALVRSWCSLQAVCLNALAVTLSNWAPRVPLPPFPFPMCREEGNIVVFFRQICGAQFMRNVVILLKTSFGMPSAGAGSLPSFSLIDANRLEALGWRASGCKV